LLAKAQQDERAYRLYKQMTAGQDTPEQKSAVDRYQSALLMPEWLLILFGYLVPFWELGVGLCIVLGIYRTAASVFAMALIAIFLAGGEATHAVDYPNMIIEIIQMYVFGFAYFFLYRELERNPQDPLALDNLRFKPGRDRR